jgi:hypothetical protein
MTTFDRMDAGIPNPPVYIASSLLFRGEIKNSFGTSINGKVSKVTGAILNVVTDVVTIHIWNLPYPVVQVRSMWQ